ncbi:Crp/Fnr family transcriptional regulator [Candidatus Daviesbacteria bacterium]|nr:Crp/Fnr family transcriptional regulator [Candidatus Daviesbacteria bacterium]
MEPQISGKLNNFFSRFKKLSFKKGRTILRADDKPKGVLYLKKGYVRLYSISGNAQELTLIIFKAEDFFPMMWTINDTPNTYYLEAMTDTEVYQAPRREFLTFIKDNAEVLFDINSRILTRFGGVLSRMEHAIFGHAQSKVASIILICAERFGVKDKNGILIPVPLTHQDIANLIGVARETVSIEMEKLQQKGLIAHRGKNLVVKDMQKLKGESVLET